jgi:hypothetical protein
MKIRRLVARLRRRPPGAARIYRPPADGVITIERGLAVIARRWPEVRSPSTARPIFILAAGWRSGSTLLQRWLTASGSALIWGEPYGHAAMIDALAHPIRCMSDVWPHDDWFLRGRTLGELGDSWIANLAPTVEDLQRAHLRFFEAMFEEPARAAGIARWGVKETRLESDHARYLRWLFPDARLLFLVRNPYDAYRSYRRWRSWYVRWPDDAIETPGRFGAHWRGLVEGFLADHERLGALLVRYEDMLAGEPSAETLARFVDLALPPLASLERITHGRTLAVEVSPPVPAEEIAALRATVEPFATRLGYTP